MIEFTDEQLVALAAMYEADGDTERAKRIRSQVARRQADKRQLEELMRQRWA